MHPTSATILCSIATALVGLASRADSPLTEAQYIARVVGSGDTARVLEAERDTEQAELAGLGLWPNPSLEWQRESLGAGAGPTGGTQDTFVLNVPLVLSGRTFLEADARDKHRQAADARLHYRRASLVRDAILHYQRAVAGGQRRAALEASHHVLIELQSVITKRERAGDAAGYEVLRIALEASAVESELNEARVIEHRALREAAALVSSDEPISVSADARTVVAKAAGADEEVLAARADLRALQLEIDSAVAAERAAARGFIPEISLTGGAQVFRLGLPDSTWGYVVGLSLPLPLFQRGQDKRAQAQARRTLAVSRKVQLLRQARVRLDSAITELAARTTQVERFQSDVVQRAEQLRQVARAAYQGGSAELLVVVDAERAWREAQLKIVELRLLLRQAEVDVALRSGRLNVAAQGPASP